VQLILEFEQVNEKKGRRKSESEREREREREREAGKSTVIPL